MHDDRIHRQFDVAVGHDEASWLNTPNVPESNHVLDRSQLLELPCRQGWCDRHPGSYGAIDAHHHLELLEAQEQGIESRRSSSCLHDVGGHAQEDGGIGLNDGTIEHPRVSRANPADRTWVDSALEQPQAGVGGRLAGADNDELTRGIGDANDVIDRQDGRAVCNAERWRGVAGDVGGHVARVD